MVTVCADGSLRFVDPQTWETRDTAAGPHPPRWLAATGARDGRLRVAVASDRALTTWDQSADCQARIEFPADITALAGGGRCVAVALADGRVLTLDSADLAVVGQFQAEQPTTALCVLPDPWEEQIVLGGTDGRLDIVTAQGERITTLSEVGAAPLLTLTSLPLSSGESLLIGAASDLTVRAWLPARPGVPPRALPGP